MRKQSIILHHTTEFTDTERNDEGTTGQTHTERRSTEQLFFNPKS
jgi:hypothetical protein